MAITNDLLIFKYNNYYNRLVKVEDTLAGYREEGEEVYSFTANFNPGNGVVTQILVGTGDYDGKGDYLLVGLYYIDSNTRETSYRIDSRWFILDAERTRGGQYLLTLKRDVVVDYYNIVLDAPCFIEKATLATNNPLIFNKEDFQVNQIKTYENLLKDDIGCAWLVGYLSATQSIEGISVTKKNINTNVELVGNIASWAWYNYTNLSHSSQDYHNNANNLVFRIYFSAKGVANNYEAVWDFANKSYTVIEGGIFLSDDYAVEFEWESNSKSRELIDNFMTAAIAQISSLNVRTELLPNYIGDITELSGRVLKTTDNEYYNTSVTQFADTERSKERINTSGTLALLLKNIADSVTGVAQDHTIAPLYDVSLTNYKLTLTSITDEYSITFNLDINKYCTNDVYRIIAIPYPDADKRFIIDGAKSEDGTTALPQIFMSRENALEIANAIIKKGGGSSASSLVYDFQLLPYCPIKQQYNWEVFDVIKYTALGGVSPLEGKYTIVGDKGIVFEVVEPSFTFNINEPITVSEPKVENQCDMYRLCSPNWASIFEFNAAKNGGVNYFNVDCRYKPYTPYIHINPNFKLLYGQDFNDARGLILAGDFSLTSISDAYTNYELQNKTYQLMFDRQIENLEVQQKYQRINEIAGTVTGTLSGGTSGTLAGNMLSSGSVLGSTIGGIVGAGASLVGGIIDYNINEKLRHEAIDYTKDNFNYSLQAIKAKPDTLTKVSAINNNNKIYPVLEYYTCTDVEKEAFRKKLQYNGMSVGIIDTIRNYVYTTPTYIKGKIIRIEGLEDDYHVANEIAREMYLGMFI